jgi:hypothetical protein
LFFARTYRFMVFFLALLPGLVKAQLVDYDSLLQRVDTVENPVYKPVVSFSYGVMNFLGDVQNSKISPVIGNNAVSVNISTFVDRKHYFTANFFYLIGSLSGNSYSYNDISRNLNFRTAVSSIGANVEYSFGHFIDKESFIRPYLSLGLGNLSFSSKGDLRDASGMTYYYWTDGSIRDTPEWLGGGALTLHRDYNYETDLRLRENEEFGLGDYSQNTLVIPMGLGAHFRLNSRAFFSLGMSYHMAMTDMLDNVAYKGTSIQGKKGNDGFIYSHLTLHFDLFSDPTTRTVDLLYADVEFDPLLFDDEDGDFVLDVSDRCPNTPYGVAVDTLGCPLDGDMDGVADYLDQELNTRPNAWVDDLGVTVSEESYQAALELRNNAMERKDVADYIAITSGEYRLSSDVEIPEKFQVLDVDEDGYLSFDELLLAIDKYFDYQVDLDVEEVRILNDFFFSQ